MPKIATYDLPLMLIQVIFKFMQVLFTHIIYLPRFLLQEKIKKRNKFNEANSPLFKDTKFLETMEDVYKNNFLKDISTHSELLVYDWSNGGETELVVEDIERIGWSFFPYTFFHKKYSNRFHDVYSTLQISIAMKKNHQK